MKSNNNKGKSTVAFMLAAALLCGITGAGALAATATGADDTEDEEAVTSAEPAATPTPTAARESDEVFKDETVYVIAGADGGVEKIIVSDWLKNSAGGNNIQDKSALTDPEVVKGDSSYTMGGGDVKVWDAKDGDVYYQGQIDKELPVSLSVSYKLDGQPITPHNLEGKSGRVTIRFDYTNREYEMVEIDGVQEKIYVPFTMLTGMMLDNEKFSDISVSNGKLMNDGTRTAVIGLAFPGMQDNLALDSEELDLPNYVEIEADAEDFELSTVFTVATNSVFNDMDTEKLDSLDALDDLSGDLDKLNSAMYQLLDGSSALYNGLSTLLNKSGDLINGIDSLAVGAQALKAGADQLSGGAAQLKGGAAELSQGAQALTQNNAALQAGAGQVFDSMLAQANSQLSASGLSVPTLTRSNYGQVLSGVLAQLAPSGGGTVTTSVPVSVQVPQNVQVNRDEIYAQISAAVQQELCAQTEAAVREQSWSQVLAGMGLTWEDYEAGVADGTISAEEVQSAVEQAVAAAVPGIVQEQMSSSDIQALINQRTDEQVAALSSQVTMSTVTTDVQVEIDTPASQGNTAAIAAIQALKGQLDSFAQFYNGLVDYTDGVAQVAEGAKALEAGASSIQDGAGSLSVGAGQLYEGILTLKDGSGALVDGVSQLTDGAMQLNEGLQEFNSQGIQKLIDAAGGDLPNLLTRLKATVDVSKDYRNFSGLSDGMDGEVKFIYSTGDVKAEG